MLHEEVVSRLRDRLIEGEIAPGAKILEKELCRDLQVSRTPLREALKVLAAEGLVVLLENRGAQAAKLTQKDMRDLFEVCAWLEAMSGELACKRISSAEIEAIQLVHDKLLHNFHEKDMKRYYECNRDIHTMIVAAADNTILSHIYDMIGVRLRRARFVAPTPLDQWELAVREHEGIMNALTRRDGEGLSHILKTHLRNKLQQIERAGFME